MHLSFYGAGWLFLWRENGFTVPDTLEGEELFSKVLLRVHRLKIKTFVYVGRAELNPQAMIHSCTQPLANANTHPRIRRTDSLWKLVRFVHVVCDARLKNTANESAVIVCYYTVVFWELITLFV